MAKSCDPAVPRTGILDLYCERIGPGLGAEPLNAWSNLAFLVAAWASWRLARRSGPVAGSMAWLIGLMAAIGIGSALFHVFATTWARVLDQVPILAFQLGYLWMYFRRVVFLRSSYSALAVASLLITSLAGQALLQSGARSLTYLPALISLLCLGAYHYYHHQREPLTLTVAAGVFAVALILRTLDGAVCPFFPAGTHFVWHLLSAAGLYLLFRGLAANWRSQPESRYVDRVS